MLRRLFLLLSLLPLAAAAEISDSRMLALLTQDRNGVFMLTVVALPDRTQAVMRKFGEQGREPPVVDYPRERFEQLWQQAATLDLARFAIGDSSDSTAPAYNYVISVIDERDGQRQNRGYKIPKCGIAPEHEAFVRSLANGLLPPGSPGLFKPCAPASSAAKQDKAAPDRLAIAVAEAPVAGRWGLSCGSSYRPRRAEAFARSRTSTRHVDTRLPANDTCATSVIAGYSGAGWKPAFRGNAASRRDRACAAGRSCHHARLAPLRGAA